MNLKFTFVRFLAVLAAFVLVCASSYAVPRVEKVRIGQHGEKSRLVLEVSSSVRPKLFTLPSPPRVVLDFPEVKFTPDLAATTLPEKSLIKGMRQGIFKPGTIRMVLDLNEQADPRLFIIPSSGKYKHRVVVDVTPRVKPSTESKREKIPKNLAVLAKPKEPLQPIRQVEASRPDVGYIPPKPRVKKQSFVVVVDPGHGGVDPGAIGLKKTREKDVVLGVAKHLKKELEKDKRISVYLTRRSDTFVKLDERVKTAQKYDADLFISLHADAHKVRKVRGGSIYVLSEKASDKEAARLARNANAGDLMGGLNIKTETKEVRDILIDLTQRETMNQSAFLAQEALRELGKVIHLRKDKVLFAGFRVLKAPEIPSILVEMAYMSNPEEERLLKTSAYQGKIARAIAQGVQGYLKKHAH